MTDRAGNEIMVTGPAAKPGVPVVRALERGIALMRAFSAAQPRQTLTELARAAELDKGTTRRLLHTLQVTGIVEHDTRSGLYALTVGLLEIASAVDTGRELREVAAPYLGDLADRIGATSFLWIPHEGMGLCVERVRAAIPNVDAPWFTVGTRTALNCGGGPRVLLAYMSPEDREHALAQPLPKRTPVSVTDPEELRVVAQRVREQGYEFAVDDFVLGLAGLGVPIFGHDGRFVGSLSISGLTEPIRAQLDRNVALLREAARTIGRKII
ncbi:IclR family transcriptional regulator [Aliihoeflea sp. 40Bstr573]|uniref:IclR family transcriptional regulator n=1 Tax=Aliihoeflea sp. 40Bstr573 TaxID=2696467 RepID=UPI002094FE9D|nr:IclR family transcriptional regulator [Aliihoeflea sp. 40Bstr573]